MERTLARRSNRMTKSKKDRVSGTGKQRANMGEGFRRRFIGQFAEWYLLKNQLTTIFWISLQIRESPDPSTGKTIRRKGSLHFLLALNILSLSIRRRASAAYSPFGARRKYSSYSICARCC